MSKSKKHRRNKKNGNNVNDNLMELLNNIDLEDVMALLSSGQNVDNDYDENNTQLDINNLVKNLGNMNTSNPNPFNPSLMQLVNILKPIVENNRDAVEKLLQVYFLTRIFNKN